MTTQDKILRDTRQFVFNFLSSDHTGHDWWHIYRVTNMALRLAQKENANLFVVEMAALLHDVADYKLNDGDVEKGELRVMDFLKQQEVEVNIAERILQIIREVSYKGSGVITPVSSIESAVVQDADRLDAIGAIGIARTFTFGGAKARTMHHPEVKPALNVSEEEYRNREGTTLNHFYEKLLLLKNRMNTGTAREIAKERHQFMEAFLNRFHAEWSGLDI